MALEVQGSSGESNEMVITRSHDNQRAGNFLKPQILMALQIGNAACVLVTVSDRDAFEVIYYIYPFKKFLPVDCNSCWYRNEGLNFYWLKMNVFRFGRHKCCTSVRRHKCCTSDVNQLIIKSVAVETSVRRHKCCTSDVNELLIKSAKTF